MRFIKRFAALALAVLSFLVAFSACSSEQKGSVHIFSDNYAKEYQKAAGTYFSGAGWTKLSYFENPTVMTVPGENYVRTIELGTIGEGVRYVVVVSADEAILESDPAEGKRFTVFVYDNGNDDIKMVIRYNAGTTDNCVITGALTDGQVSCKQTLEVSASAVSDVSERADLIFVALYNKLVEIEGE